MRFLLCFTLLISAINISAQSFDFLNGSTFGDGEGDDDESRKIAFFQNGDVLVAGQFEGLIDFDPDSSDRFLQISLESGGEGYVARYSSNGELIWWKSVRSDRDIEIYGLLIDANEDIYITGTYIQEVIFDESNPNAQLSGVSPNDGDGYLAKYNQNGDYIWSTRFAGTGIDAGVDLEINPAGELVVLGVFGDSLQFDPNQASSLRISAGAGDVFFGGYNATTGQYLWNKSISGLGFDNPRALEIDSQGNYYINGDFTATITFSLNPLVALVRTGGNDVFVAKYDVNRNFKWAEKIAGSSTDLGANMELYNDTLLAISGTFRGNIQLDPSGNEPLRTGNGFNPDVFLVALDTAANFQWGLNFGGSSTDNAAGLQFDANNHIWIGGYLVNSVDVDPDPTQSFNIPGNGGDGFIAAYNINDGSFYTAHHLDGSSFTRVLDLNVAPDGKIWSGGALYGTANFNSLGTSLNLSSPSNSNSNSFFAAYQSTSFDTAWTTEDRMGGSDFLTRTEFSNDGGILSTGYFEGGIDVDPDDTATYFLDSRGAHDIFLCKYSNNFDFEWAIQMGGASTDQATALREDVAGNIYLAGHYQGTFYFDNNGMEDSLVSASQYSIFLAKLNPQGQLLWMKDIQGLGQDYAYDLSLNSTGDLALAGSMRGNISFDGVNTSSNVSNNAAFIAIFDTSGTFQWSQIVDGPSNEYAYTVLASESGDFYLGGSYRNTVDFDPGANSDSYTSQFGGNDVFISKYASDGSYQWVKVYGQNSFEAAYALTEDDAQNLYIAGDFSSKVDFNPPSAIDTLTSNGSTDAFLLSLDDQGNFRWVRQLGGTSGDKPNDLKIINGQVYHTGYFYFSADLNPGPDTLLESSLGQHAIYLQVLDTAGTFVDALALGGTGEDIGSSVDHFNGQTIIGGHFERAVDFDPNPSREVLFRSLGDEDGFLLKLGNAGPCPTEYDSIQVQACGSYAWQGQTYTQSGFYQKTLFTQQGCDSILSLDLIINPSYDSLLTISACDSFQWRGTTYFQSGMYGDSLLSSANCDSVFRLDLSISPSYLIQQSQSACDSFQWRGATYHQSGSYFDSLSSSNTCDSVYQLDLIIHTSKSDTSYVQACDSFLWRGVFRNASGFYSDTLSTSQGCDSILILSLNLSNSYRDTLLQSACDSFQWRGTTYFQSGFYQDSLISNSGCDSIFNLDVTIFPSYADTSFIQACDSFQWEGQYYSQSGFYSISYQSQDGCDSIKNLDLSIHPSFLNISMLNSCDSVTWRGQSLNQSGTYFDSLQTVNGCDSVYQFILHLDQSFVDSIQVDACGMYNWRGTNYTQSGRYYDSLNTQISGCDSVYIIDLNIDQPFSDTLSTNACDSFQWRGSSYNQSGFYYDSLLTAGAGCDSVYVLDLSIYNSSTNPVSASGCDSVIVAGVTYYTNGFFIDTLQSIHGCDSILSITTFIDSLDNTVVSNGFSASAQQNNAKYQWLNCDNGFQMVIGATAQNFDPSVLNAPNANYAVQITNGNCVDTSDCFFLQNIGLAEWSQAEPKLWPNPSNGNVYLQFPVVENYHLELFDAQGRLLKEWNSAGNSRDENFELPEIKGSYFIRIRNSAGEYWRGTIIKK